MLRTPATIVQGADVWRGSDFSSYRSWVYELTRPMIDEIKDATLAARRRGIGLDRISRNEFPVPALHGMLEHVYDDLENGCGFAVIAGMPVEAMPYDDLVLAYAGVGSHLGVLVDQSYQGDLKVDVIDAGLPYSKDSRGYMSNAALRFHTDGASIIGLLCLAEAREGGASVIVSTGAASNEVLRRRPDLHAILVEGFHHHRRGQHAPGDNPISNGRIPVFGFFDGLIHGTYDRNQSLWAAEEGATLTPQDIEAMDLLDAILAEPEMQLPMEMRIGDMQLINNFTVMHSRTEYFDGDTHKRHLVRLWFDDPGAKRKGVTVRDLYTRQKNDPADRPQPK